MYAKKCGLQSQDKEFHLWGSQLTQQQVHRRGTKEWNCHQTFAKEYSNGLIKATAPICRTPDHEGNWWCNYGLGAYALHVRSIHFLNMAQKKFHCRFHCPKMLLFLFSGQKILTLKRSWIVVVPVAEDIDDDKGCLQKLWLERTNWDLVKHGGGKLRPYRS